MASSSCVKNNTKKKPKALFTQTEIEAASLLIHLSTAAAGSASATTTTTTTTTTTLLDRDSNNNSCSNSVQWKPELAEAVAGADVEEEIEDVLADIEEDERLRRKKKRYRYVEELYSATEPLEHVPAVEANNKKFTK